MSQIALPFLTTSRNIAILGMPGAGKTTLGAALSAVTGLPHTSAGDVARRLAEKDSETAQCLADGKIAPPRKMAEAMADEIMKGGQIIDGFPRYMSQMADLLLYSPRLPLFVVLDLGIPAAMLRLKARGREDDENPQIVARMSTYQTETIPVVQWIFERLPSDSILISAGQTPEQVMREARQFVEVRA